MLVWNSSWVQSLFIVMVLTCSWVSVLVKVHQDILNLCLLWRVHYHDNRRCWLRSSGHISCSSIPYCIVTRELIACASILLTQTVIRVKSLGSRSSSRFLLGLLLTTHEAGSTNTSTSRCLAFWGSLLLVVVTRCEIIVSCILVLLLISIINWSCTSYLCMLF